MRKIQLTAAGLALALMLIMGWQMAFAQGIITGSLAGTVVDSTGAIIPGAKVTAKSVETNSVVATTTNETGYFQLNKLLPGQYVITVEATNFRTTRISGTTVGVAQENQLGKIQMQIGGKTEVVEVQSSAPLIETQTAQLSMTFDSKKVADLPLGRGMDQLALYLPGVATAGGAGRGNNNGALFSANGQRPRSNNFQIDGQSMNDPSVTGPAIFLQNNDIIAEYQVMTNYDAAYGRNTGSQVNIITKSGSNVFHGTAFEVWRGSTFDSLANQDKNVLINPSYCLPNQSPTTGCTEPVVPRYVQNTFGGTFGGPIKKDKAWFFGSALWDKPRSGNFPTTSGSALTPTATGLSQIQALVPNSPGLAMLKSKWGPLQTAGNPVVNRVPFATDPSGTGYKTIPLCMGGTGSSCTGGTWSYIEAGQLTRAVPSVSNTTQYSARGDVQLTSKDRLFGRYIYDNAITTNNDDGQGGQNGFYYDLPSRGQQVGVDWTHQFTNTMLNQARFNWTRLSVLFQGGTTGCTVDDPQNCPTSVGINETGAGGTPQAGNISVMPLGMLSSIPQGRSNNTYEIQDNANWTHGMHSMKFGGYWNNQHPQTPFLPNYNGAWTFNTFTDFINNNASRLAGVNGNFNIKYKETDLGFYFQDDIRLRSDFTLSLGLRWEWFQQTVNQIHDLTVAQQTGSNPYWNTTLPLDLTTIHQVPEDYNNLGPVIGFAWNARSKVVVRGGFRIAYDPAYYNILLNVASGAPAVNSVTLQTAAGDVVPGLPASDFSGVGTRPQFQGALPVGTNPGFRTQSLIADNFHNPYSEQWNLGLQYEISPKMALEVRYLGNHSVGLFQQVNQNTALNPLINNGWASVIPSGITPCTTGTAASTPGFSQGYQDCSRRNVLLRNNGGGSNYNGLQSKLEVRSFYGLTSTLTYTWAHAIDNVSDIYASTSTQYGGIVTYPQNPFDPGNGERGNSSFDYRHTLGIQMIYEFPFFKDQKGFLGKALGGWQSNIIYRYTTGQPWTPNQLRASTYGNSTFSACDPGSIFSTTNDVCRPILSNPNAPENSVGYISAITGGVPTVKNMIGNTATLLQNVRWLVNNPLAAQYFGSPYLGVQRNSVLGQPTHAMNFGMQKNFRLTERFTFQLNATAFNVLNHMFRGVYGNNIMRASTSFYNNSYNNSGGGNATTIDNGLSRRRLQFGGKIIF